jgi:vanillate O-demethylase monooxygenase subunit
MSEDNIEPFVQNAWYVCAWSHEIGSAPLARKILNVDLVMFRGNDGQASVLEDRCCHRAAPLSLGNVVEGGIQCGYHGLVFDAKGQCVDNPGEKINTSTFHVRAYPLIERQNMVWVWMGDPAVADENQIPSFDYHDQLDIWPFQFGYYNIQANYMFMMDNLLDQSHLAYVHASTIGGSPDAHLEPILDVTPTDTGVHYLRWMLDTPAPPSFVKLAGFEDNVDRWADFEYVAPCTIYQWGGALEVGRQARQNRDQEGGVSLRIFHHATPETETSCHYFWSAANKLSFADTPEGKAIFEDIAYAFSEDKVFLELQQKRVSADTTRPLLLRERDKTVAIARRVLHDMQNRDKNNPVLGAR